MHNSMVPILALMITLILLKDVSLSMDPHYLYHDCPRSDFSYTSASTFEANLTYALMTALPNNASLASFSNLTIGQDVDTLYALSYCRGDIGSHDCFDCVQDAGKKLLQLCRLHKEGITWYEECTVRYANHSIWSVEEELPAYRQYNFSSVLHDLDQHQKIFDSTMDSLIQQAAYGTSSTSGWNKLRGFATAKASLSNSQLILWGLVQCSPDVLGEACEKCLRSALKQRDGWSTTIIYLPSCSIRFDLYTSQISLTTPPTDSGKSKGSVLAILVSVVVAFLLSTCIFVLLLMLCYCSDGQVDSIALRRYSYWEILKATHFFQEKVLGSGGFGKVYRGTLVYQDSLRFVAIKRLKFRKNTRQRNKDFLHEINIIKGFQHPNVVSVYGYCGFWRERLIVYEYVPNKTLEHHLHDSKERLLTWEERKTIAIRLAQVFDSLHKQKDIHRDIKPANILIDTAMQPKVADFGIAKLCPVNRTHITTQVIGTRGYLDPYYHRTDTLSSGSDVFAFGIVLCELITGYKAIFIHQETRLPTHILDKAMPLIKSTLLEPVANDDSRPENPPIKRFYALVDPQLDRYSDDEVERMAICAAYCVQDSRDERPSMEQVVAVLEGDRMMYNKFKQALMTKWDDESKRRNFLEGQCSNTGLTDGSTQRQDPSHSGITSPRTC